MCATTQQIGKIQYMCQPSENPSAQTLNRWQFSLSGMLLITLSVAIGADVVRCNILSWTGFSVPGKEDIKVGLSGGLIVAIVFWMILGVINQIRDLLAALISHRVFTKEQRWGARFEIFWRLAVTTLLAVYVFLPSIIDRGRITLSDWDSTDWLLNMGEIREFSVILLFLAVVGSIPYVRREQRTSILRFCLLLVAYILAIVFCLVTWMSHTLVLHFTHIVTLGIDQAQPIKFDAINPRYYNFYASLFFWWSLISIAFVFVNWLILKHLARQWSAGLKRRLLWSVLLITGIAFASVFVIWININGLCMFSPFLVKAESHRPYFYWIAAALIIIIVATLLTYRMTADYNLLAIAHQASWRQNPNKYYHEKWWLLLLLVVAIVWFHGHIFFSLNNTFIPATKSYYRTIIFWPYLLDSWLSRSGYLWISLILLIIHRAFTRRNDLKHPQAEIPQINPAQFVTVWIATTAFVISGALVLVWMSFALWFNPWFRGRWP
jgi:hypothetical protein